MHRKSSVNSQEIVLCQNPVKHVRWSVLKIKSTAFGRYLFLQNTQSYMFDSFMNTSLLCCECFPRNFWKIWQLLFTKILPKHKKLKSWDLQPLPTYSMLVAGLLGDSCHHFWHSFSRIGTTFQGGGEILGTFEQV